MTYYLKNGSVFTVTNKENMDIHETLPPGNYVVKLSPQGFYLETSDAFDLPGKLYGDTASATGRILNTFHDRPTTTGVLLSGEKGSGKSLLAKNVSIEAAKIGIPTLLVNAAYHGDQFNSFIESMQQPIVILFDEFEKVYSRDDQEFILTLLDGTVTTKKLFVLTVNDRFALSSFMQNRPGRIFYSKKFDGIGLDFVREYAADNLKNQDNAASIERVFNVFDKFNFDMLKAIVEEMNRYAEDAVEALKWLNIDSDMNRNGYAITKCLWKGLPLNVADQTVNVNPYTESLEPYFYVRPSDANFKKLKETLFEGEDDMDNFDGFNVETRFEPRDIKTVDNGTFTYHKIDGSMIELQLKRDSVFSAYHHLRAF